MKQNKTIRVKVTPPKSKQATSAKSSVPNKRKPKKSGNHKRDFTIEMGGSVGPAKGNLKASYKPSRNTLSPTATPGHSGRVAQRSCSDHFRFGEFMDDGTTVVGPRARNQILLNIPVNMSRIVEAARVLSAAKMPYASDPFIESSYQFTIDQATCLLEYTAPDSISGTIAMFVTSNGDDVITPDNVLSVYSSLPASAKCEIDTKMAKRVSFSCGLTYLQEDPTLPNFDPRLVFGGYVVVFVKMPFVAGLASDPGRSYLGPICSCEMRLSASYHGFQYGRSKSVRTSRSKSFNLTYVPGLPPVLNYNESGTDYSVYQCCFAADAELAQILQATADDMRQRGQLIGTTGSVSQHVTKLERGPRPAFLSDGEDIPTVTLDSQDGTIPGAAATSVIKAIHNLSPNALAGTETGPINVQYVLFHGAWLVRLFSNGGPAGGPWDSNGAPTYSQGYLKSNSELANRAATTFFNGDVPSADGDQPLFFSGLKHAHTGTGIPEDTIELWLEEVDGVLLAKSTYGQPIRTAPADPPTGVAHLTQSPAQLADTRHTWIQSPFIHLIHYDDAQEFTIDGIALTSDLISSAWTAQRIDDPVPLPHAIISGMVNIPSHNIMGPGHCFVYWPAPDAPELIDLRVEQQFGPTMYHRAGGIDMPEFYLSAYSYDSSNHPLRQEDIFAVRYAPDQGPVHYDGGEVPCNMSVAEDGPTPKLVATQANTRPGAATAAPTKKRN